MAEPTKGTSKAEPIELELEEVAATAAVDNPSKRTRPASRPPSAVASRPPSAASARPHSRTSKRNKLVAAEEEHAACCQAAARAVRRQARANAKAWRKDAGLESEEQKEEVVCLDEADTWAQPGPEDELADLLQLLYTKHVPPNKAVENAEVLVEVLKSDPGWLARISKPMCLARHAGGKLDEVRLLTLFDNTESADSRSSPRPGTEPADSRSGGGCGGGEGSVGEGGPSAPPPRAERCAQVLRKREAWRHWSLGALDSDMEHGSFASLQTLMEQSKERLKTTVRKMGDKQHRNKWTVDEWRRLPEGRILELPKILFWPLRTSPLADMVTLPRWLVDANWVASYPGDSYDVMLQLVHSFQSTGSHFDNNGVDTWMKVLAGKVLVATWSLAEAEEYEMRSHVDWRVLRRMDSARLFFIRQGDVLVLPAGTYHYVYTVTRKIVLAGDFINASGWRTRVVSVERFGVDPSHGEDLSKVFSHGLIHIEKERAAAALKKGEPLTARRHAYLRSVLEWADALREEGARPAGGAVRKVLETQELQAALQVVRQCVKDCAPLHRD